MNLFGQQKSGHPSQNFGEAWLKGRLFIVGVTENKNVLENEVL